MSQRINASRVVFSVNMNSPVVDKPGSGYALPQSRRSNNMRWGAISPLEHPISQPAQVEPIDPPSDRRMSRRQINNQMILPRGINRQQAVPSSLIQELAEYPEAADIQPLTGGKLPEQVQVPTDKTAALIPPLYTTPPPESAVEEIEEPYLIDRPVHLLGQKYFGTRY